MKELYKYLAVAACALLGAGSATAVTGPAKMYLSSSRGGNWSGGPTLMTTADNKNDVFEFKGLPFVQNEYFVLSDAKFSGWTVSKRYTTKSLGEENVSGNYGGEFTEGSDGCWKVTTAGIYDISINYTTKTIGITQVTTGLSNVYRLNSAITGNSSWQVDIMTYNNGIWEYTGTLNEGQFGIQQCNPNTGSQTKWMGGACTINDVNTSVSFSNIQNSANSQNNLSGVYTIKYDPANDVIEFSDSQGGGESGDITLDDHGTTYATVPQMTDLMLAYWVGKPQKVNPVGQDKNIGIYDFGIGDLPVTFGWAKYEDTSDYLDWMIQAGDTEEIATKDSNEHDCRNFNDAYYRMYEYTLQGRPGLKYDKNAVSTTGRKAPRVVPEQGVQHSRVARTFPMKDNTTGVDDIITDGGTSVEDTNAPVIWYNLQGQRVNNPSNGVFIRQQGSKVTKEYIH